MIIPEIGMHITTNKKSATGRIRDHNEHACLVDLENNLFIVLDGN